jgi:DNA-binding GntR family transcriptional regulator
MLEAVLRAKKWPSLRRRLTREHRGIYEAIEKGDDEQASALVAQHIRKFYNAHLGRSPGA